MPGDYTIGAYYFPNYHADARNAARHGAGWTEWDLVRRAEPRFPGHRQPRVPAWGYEDEADPAVMARKIAAAADHGVDVFLYDWYHYEDGPYLQRGLDEGFLGAPNVGRLRFALMWANHDWIDIHPHKLRCKAPLQWPGAVPPAAFDRIMDLVIERYFRHPSYWLVDGRPYFSIYELKCLVAGLGGVAATRRALDRVRERVRAAGFPDLHLNAVVWSVGVLPGEAAIKSPQDLVDALGFDSLSSYVWVHHVRLKQFPTTPYADVAAAARNWAEQDARFRVPFFPNVTMGWDSSPRTVQSDRFENAGYPFMPALDGNTPAAFEAALRDVKRFLDGRAAPKVFSINAWNEWTEGSYLEPDTVTGMGYLDAIRRVFG